MSRADHAGGHVPSRRSDRDLIGKTARLHYDFGLTHQEVSEVLQISRVKVTRLLAQARELGVVQITVHSDASPYVALEHELAHRFGLKEAMVVPTFDDELARRRAVARGVATYLQRVLHDGMSVTLGFSRTLAVVPQFIASPPRVDVTFVALAGGLGRTPDALNAHESIERLAQLFGGRAEHLHAPAVMGSRKVAAALCAEPAIKRALDFAARADLVLMGLGGMATASATLVASGDVAAAEVDELIALGAVGDVTARFFDAGGQPVELSLKDRLVGLTLEQIRAIPARLIAAAGPEKHDAMAAALASGLATVAVSDAATAQSLIELPHG